MTPQRAYIVALSGFAAVIVGVILATSGRASAGDAAVQLDPAVTNPVARTNQADFSSTNRTETGTHYTVPTGKRLVIEVISGRASVAAGTKIRSTLTTRVAGGAMNTQLLWDLQSVEGTHHFFAFTLPVRLYADAGTKVDITTIRSSLADTGGTTYSFSGYLVNMP